MTRRGPRPVSNGVVAPAATPAPEPAEGCALRPARRAAQRCWPGLAGLLALLAIVAGNWLLWTSAVPFGEAPDEPSHADVAQFIAVTGRLPVFGPNADAWMRLDQVGIPIEPHALAPPLPYLIGAALIRLADLPPFVAMRVTSLLAALTAVALTWGLVHAFLPRARGLALPVAALVAFTPQLSFQAAVASNDVVALCAAVGLALTWPAARHRRGALLFGAALGLALLAKLTVYPVAAVTTMAALGVAWQASAASHSPPGSSARRWPAAQPLAARLGLVALGALVVAGPWLAHNLARYGEPVPLRVSALAFAALTPAIAIAGNTGAPPLLSPAYLQGWTAITLPSLVAAFGRVDLFAPGSLYGSVAAGCFLSFVGLLLAQRQPGWWSALGGSRPGALMLALWPLACVLATVAASTGRYFPPHGRYLLPLLPPVALGVVLGWRALAPPRLRRRVPWSLAVGVAALNIWCLFTLVVPAYFGPASTRVALTVDEPRPGDVAAGPTVLRGWAVVSGRERWVPGVVGGGPAWHAPASRVWATADDDSTELQGASGLPRLDVARALAAPHTAASGFEFLWAANGAAGILTLTACASDPRAAAPVCVPVPLRVP